MKEVLEKLVITSSAEVTSLSRSTARSSISIEKGKRNEKEKFNLDECPDSIGHSIPANVSGNDSQGKETSSRFQQRASSGFDSRGAWGPRRPKDWKILDQDLECWQGTSGSFVCSPQAHSLQMEGDPKPKELSYHAKVPALGIWKSAAVEIETKVDVTWDKLCIIADATNQVTESNEDNNKFCGLGTDINGDPPQP